MTFYKQTMTQKKIKPKTKIRNKMCNKKEKNTVNY